MHEAKTSAIEAERAAVDKRAEDQRRREMGEVQKEKLQTALRRSARWRLESLFSAKACICDSERHKKQGQ